MIDAQDTLEDMRAAFPGSAVVKSSNLHTFMNSVEGLFRIGDYQVGTFAASVRLPMLCLQEARNDHQPVPVFHDRICLSLQGRRSLLGLQ